PPGSAVAAPAPGAASSFASGLAGALVGAGLVFAVTSLRPPAPPAPAPAAPATRAPEPAPGALPPLTVTGRVIEIRDDARTAVIQAEDAAYVIRYVEIPDQEPKIGATISVTGHRGVLDAQSRRVLFADRAGQPARPPGVTPQEI